MKSSLEAVHEISKLIKKSPKRSTLFEKLKQELASETISVCALCLKQWTVRAASSQSILDNYEILLNLWEESLESLPDSETRARIVGVEAQMAKFVFLFWCFLGCSNTDS